MKKRIALLVLAALMITTLSACSGKKAASNTDETTTEKEAVTTEAETTTAAPVVGCDYNIASLKGPTSIGLVKLFSDSDNGNTINKYNYSIYGTADEISAGIVNGSIDVAAVPCNLASVLYNKTEGAIQVAAINTLGVLYIVEKNETINSVADLKGKTIYMTGQGTTPEYTLRYLLSSNGIDPDTDVTIQFCSEAAEVVSTIKTMDSAVAMLPQPYVTVAQTSDAALTVALDVTEEWEKTGSDSTVVTGVVIARKAFIEEHPDQFEEFLKEYQASTEYANSNVEDTAALVESFDIFKAAIAQKAIPECNVTFITGSDMKSKVAAYLQVLSDANPKAVGGKLPDDNFYYTGK